VDRQEFLAEEFEAHRSHLRAVAHRMLGSTAEADDAVQEAWFRLARTDTSGVENLGGWLTTVVARVCLDMLRSRTSRREDPIGDTAPDELPAPVQAADPEHEATLTDSIGVAMLVVLDTLSPNERLAFVLHDMFAVPFDEIGTVIGCSTATARQHASRARRRVQGADPATGAGDSVRRQRIVNAFLAAARGGDFDALLSLLAPDAVMRADAVAVASGAAGEVVGAAAVAEVFAGRARGARLALVDGAAGVIWATGGRIRAVFDFTIVDGRVAGIDLMMDPASIDQLDVVLEGQEGRP
jgi:RNA polymerase sigma-70 factor, ECF subfamily